MSPVERKFDNRRPAGSPMQPLRNRNFVLVWLGQSISSVGNGMYAVTLAWTVYTLTHSAARMGIVLAANSIPQLVLLLFGGVLADRVERRLVILSTNVAAAGITGTLAFMASTHSLSVVGIVAASFGLGVTSAFFGPAYGALFKDILSDEERISANSIRGITNNVVKLASPALGGLVYAAGGAQWGFGLDAISFLVSVAALGATSIPPRKMQVSGTVFGDIRDAVFYIIRTGWLWRLILTALIANTLCIAPMEVLLALIVRNSHHSPSFLGILLSWQALFAAAGAAAIGKLARRIRALTGFFVLSALLDAGVAITGAAAGTSIVLFLGVALVGAGFASNTLEDIVMQTHVPGELLGRIYGVGMVAAFSLLPLGFAAAGAAARALGPNTVLVIGGTCGALLSLAFVGATETTRLPQMAEDSANASAEAT